MSLIKFESTVKLDEDRKDRHEARERILAKAKADHDKRKAREERRKGEQWMLPSVSARLGGGDSDRAKDKDKKNEKKRKKKKKKQRRNERKQDDSDDSANTDSDQCDEDEWVEKKVETKSVAPSHDQEKPMRDSWMTLPANFVSTLSKEEMKRGNQSSAEREQAREAEKQRRLELEKPGQHARELNPYWKDGGGGLPCNLSVSRHQSSSVRPESGGGSGQVGDGGLEVLLRARRRAVQQSEDEQRPLEEVVAERWGSLDNLDEMIAEKRKLLGQSQDRWRDSRPDRHHNRDHHRRQERDKSSPGRSGPSSDRVNDSRRSPTAVRHFRPTSSASSRDRVEPATTRKCVFLQPKMDDADGDSAPDMTQDARRQPEMAKSSAASSGWRKPRETPTSVDVQADVSPKFNRKDDGRSDADVQPAAVVATTAKGVGVVSAHATVEPISEPPPPQRPTAVAESKAGPSSAETAAPLTDKELNVLGAKIVKAELMGNETLAKQLRAKLDAAREARKAADASGVGAASATGGGAEKERVVVLTRTDARGMTRPLAEAEYAAGASSGGRRKKAKKEATHDSSGQRQKYFADDDRYSLKQMFEREKLGTAEDQNKMFVRLAGQGLEPTNEDYDVDDVFVGRANRRIDDSRTEAQERLAAIGEFNRSTAAMDNCRFCFDGKDTPKHLIIAIGLKVYVTLPAMQSLTDGHCLIVPMQHVAGSTYLDEDVWSEIQIFRKGLTKMFEAQQRDVVFFESMMHLKRFPHMTLQCVPLPNEEGSLAPMYFKKAILESETEWAMNKKLVDLSVKNIRRAVPKGLPYFSVDFGLQGGFAHVIEDEQAFPKNFAQEILGGMLDLDANTWRRPAKENFDTQRKKVLQFAEWWKPYDWTRRLKEND